MNLIIEIIGWIPFAIVLIAHSCGYSLFGYWDYVLVGTAEFLIDIGFHIYGRHLVNEEHHKETV